MLLNNNAHSIVLKWDGRDVTIKANEQFHVGQYFDVKISELSGLEARFMGKNKNLVRVSGDMGSVTAPSQSVGPVVPEIEQTPKAAETEAQEGEETEEAPINENGPRALSDHNKNELQTMAKQLGLTFTDKTTKADLIKSIDKALAAAEE